jgi:hypothetical protein
MNHQDKLFMLINSKPRRLSLSMIGCVLVFDLIWFPFSAISISRSSFAVLMAIAGVFLLAVRIQHRYELSATTKNLAVELYILVLFGVVGFIFSYLVIESGWTIRDDLFAAIDNALGFDWRTYTLLFLQNICWLSAFLVLPEG